MSRKLIAVITPFLDKSHGTERCLAEQIERLSKYYEFHIYSMRVKDIDAVKVYRKGISSDIYWHKVPDIKGPQLLRYIWWFVANHFWRLYDYLINGIKYDIKYSPGINCVDAKFIVVHHVFIEFYKCVRKGMRFSDNPIKFWFKIIHRHLYYSLIILLEQLIYRRKNIVFGAVSDKVRKLMKQYFNQESYVIYHGADFIELEENARLKNYNIARKKFNISDSEFVILLVGNDWYEKGLQCLLKTMSLLPDIPLHLIIRGRDEKEPYNRMIKSLKLPHRISFFKPVPNIFELYAASDLYISPSLYDSFAMPPLEAMYCGLPAIVSSRAGVSELITNNVDGIILDDPMDHIYLANKIKLLYEDRQMLMDISKKAIETAQKYTWQKNAELIKEIFDKILADENF